MEVEVAIIGAGIAGVTAASRLAAAKIKCLLFEADKLYGGRTRSIRLAPDITVNLGANWLAGDKNPLRRYVECKKECTSHENGITVLNADYQNINAEYIPASEEYMLALDKLEKSLDEKSEFCSIEKGMKKVGYQIPDNSYIYDAVQYMVGNAGYSGFSDAESSVGDIITTELAIKENGEDLDLVVADTSSIIPGIAAEFGFDLDSILLEHCCVQINWSNKKYELYFSNGSTVIANIVICTVPIGILKGRKIKTNFFDETRLAIFDQVPLGHFSNVFAFVKCENMTFDQTDIGKVFYFKNQIVPFRSLWLEKIIKDSEYLIHFMTVGDQAIQISQMNRETLGSLISLTLQNVYKNEFQVLNFSHPNWSVDPNFLGCYTNCPILDQTTAGMDFYEQLGAPMNDETFFFAGEAFDYLNGGFMQGAYNTANRVVDQILAKRT